MFETKKMLNAASLRFGFSLLRGDNYPRLTNDTGVIFDGKKTAAFFRMSDAPRLKCNKRPLFDWRNATKRRCSKLHERFLPLFLFYRLIRVINVR